MFASDFPVAGLHATYDQVFDAFKAIVADFSAGEQRQLFHDNAARLYRLRLDNSCGSNGGRHVDATTNYWKRHGNTK